MHVFISWSGVRSRRVALALRDWLPGVINAAEPYVSSEDIEKGARWSADITGKLNSTSIGIICVTRENMNQPWINFEAGALSKAVGAESRVIPLLIDLGNADLVGPLNQFQTVLPTEEEMRKLVDTINSNADKPNPSHVVDKVFRALWSELDGQFKKIWADAEQPPLENPPRTDREMLQELVELSRDIQRSIVDDSVKRDLMPVTLNKKRAEFRIEKAAQRLIENVLNGIPEAAPDLDWMIGVQDDHIQVFIMEERTDQIDAIVAALSKELEIRNISHSFEFAIIGRPPF